MKYRHRIVVLTAAIQLILYLLSMFILSRFMTQVQIHHLQTLKEDYQDLHQENNQRYLHAWAQNHQLQIVVDSRHPQGALQHQVHDLVLQEQVSNNNPYQIKSFKGSKYIFYLLDNLQTNHQKIIVKKYQSLGQNLNLVVIFTLIYWVLSGILLIVQGRLMYRRERYMKLIIRKLKNIEANEQTDSLVTQDNTPYAELIHAVNALDHHNASLVENNALLKRRFQGLMAHLPVGVMLLDADGNVILHNQAMALILGVNISNEPHPFVEDIQTYALSRMIEHTLRKNRNHHRQIQLYGDSEHYVDANVIRLTHSDEDLKRQVIVILYDLTPSRQIEQQQLDFVDNVSQELQPSVTQIINLSTTLLKQPEKTIASSESQVQEIKSAADNLNELIADSQTLTTLDRQNNALPDRINTQALIDQELKHYQAKIAALDLQVTTDYQGNVWVSSYTSALTQIFHNLISNGVKYNRAHGQLQIQLNHNEVENYLEIKIQDTGCGIALADQKHVFERFYRANKQSTGSGLGLAIVHEAVTALNGTINLTSQLNQGTTVQVHLPL